MEYADAVATFNSSKAAPAGGNTDTPPVPPPNILNDAVHLIVRGVQDALIANNETFVTDEVANWVGAHGPFSESDAAGHAQEYREYRYAKVNPVDPRLQGQRSPDSTFSASPSSSRKPAKSAGQ